MALEIATKKEPELTPDAEAAVGEVEIALVAAAGVGIPSVLATLAWTICSVFCNSSAAAFSASAALSLPLIDWTSLQTELKLP